MTQIMDVKRDHLILEQLVGQMLWERARRRYP